MKKTLLFASLAILATGLAFTQTITVTQPAGGSFAMGAACPVHWTTTGAVGNVKIQLIRPGGGLVDPLANRLDPGSSPYPWVVASPAVVGESYRIRVITTDGTTQGESEVFTVTAAGDPGDPGDPGTPGTISNVHLSGASPYTLGSSVTVSWTATGVSQHLKLQLVHSGGGLVGPIVSDLSAGTTSYSWPAGQYIGGTATAGTDFVIRVSTVDNALTAESTMFELKAGSGITEFTLVDLSALQVQRNLEMLSVRYVFNRGGWIVARVKNHINAINMDVSFRLTFPEGGGPGAQTITRRVTMAAGAEGDMYLQPLAMSGIPPAGLLTRVMVDGPTSQITETNEGDNTREARLSLVDIRISAPRDDLELSRLYLQGGWDFRVKFKIRVSHNREHAVNNIMVKWEMFDSGGLVRGAHGEWTIASLDAGEEWVKQVDQKFGKQGNSNAHEPKLQEGTSYRVVASITSTDDFSSNNTSGFSFTIPD
jgi:hypothetical protein